ncbi:MAG: cache domain-containing protein [Bacteroidales bacterium]|nr:cache domain-containing protein [Bacteroidales bacterium]
MGISSFTNMPQDSLNRFFISIVLPAILAIVLFILAIFVVILPSSEKNIMEGKKEMITELTNSVCSLMEEYQQEALKKQIDPDSARALAVDRVSRIRYGGEQKDYFWIIDKQPIMIMHPYRPELVGNSMINYQDPDGKFLFMESVRTVEESGEGFIDYKWQWKDDSTRIVPKLSYVREFKSWDWIVGTGIYLEDVRLEIRLLKNKLIRVALIITLIICILLTIIIRQSLVIERKKKTAEDALLLSREKYKSLVEAATEGTLMMVEGEFVFSNFCFSALSGYTHEEVRSLIFEELFSLKMQNLAADFKDPKKSISRESMLLCKDGSQKEVVISASLINFTGQTGYIFVIKELNSQMHFEKDHELLSGELQTLLMMMHQPLKVIAREIRSIHADASIREAIKIMSRKQNDILFVNHGKKIVGVINQHDLTERVLATGLDPDKKVIEIMSSPVVTLSENALLYEGLLKMKKRGLSHMALMGPKKKITGAVGFREIGGMQENMAGFLINEIAVAEGEEQLKRIYRRLPVLVKALSESGGQTAIINRIICSVGDAINRRFIDLAMEELGPAPCKFAFIAMGSQGRGEQTLTTDQDNAIITVNMQESYRQEAQAYFQVLAKKVNMELDAVGYRFCQEEIMASNPKWNRELNGWKKYFSEWIGNSNPKDILDAAIFFDFRYIYGEKILVDLLRTHINKASKGKAVFFYHMARSINQMKIPVKLDDHSLDMKKVLLPVTSYIRLHAIRENLSATGSMERAAELQEKGIFNPSLLEELTQAFDFITHLRIRSQAASISRNEAPGNTIDSRQLDRIEKMILKKHLQDITRLQTRLSGEFSSTE